ncbi:DUF4097 family beta strand repeat-containing protein [Dyadobacter sp. CY345]|uniref:DUF4097 family beta strand repeat-containing protein n=1 Tax=Dyadobacter sp. CY345 TaxID=2909335 RepID=UPI001F2E17FB|nr:DUF4097 family beta strand repeat-containing protein [Dyadobacter sp. CY345]MCF2446983.1 DUF4097 family beta strand repeat-containing protein [Dyadobacter sp. CY345]
MNRYLKTGLLLLLCTAVEAQSNIKGQLVVSLENPGKPGTVDINLVYGSINIQAYAGTDVIVDASGELPGEKGQGMKRLTKGNPLGLSAEEKNNHVTINTNSALFPVNVSIKVPRRTSLKLRTYDKGDIIVENVIGDMEVDNVNGSITLNNVGGSILANTYNGLLKASFRKISLDKPMAFSSMGGRIDLSYPASLKADLKVKSEQGEVFSDFDVSQGAAKMVKSSSSGVNKSTLDDWLYGKISGGGPEIMISNYYGNIYLKKLK